MQLQGHLAQWVKCLQLNRVGTFARRSSDRAIVRLSEMRPFLNTVAIFAVRSPPGQSVVRHRVANFPLGKHLDSR
jgi:hypothetical protein